MAKRKFFKAGTVAALHKPLPVKLSGSWVVHLNAVHPLIKELDHKRAQSMANAPRICVSNETKHD